MCGMCSDYVASCWVCTQSIYGNNGKTIRKQFYLETGNSGKFCEHFVERYKTDSPCMYSHVSTEHSQENDEGNEYWIYDCEYNCVEDVWYTEENLRAIVDAFNQWGEA